MADDIWKWLFSVITSTGLIGGVAYLFRDTFAKYLTKAVEHRFEKKLETFKANIRDNGSELEQIRSFLVSARRDRDSALQVKQLEAAECLIRNRDALAQFSMLVEYLQILKVEELLKIEDDQKVVDFASALIKPFDIEEKFKTIGVMDKTLPRLYLRDETLKHFETYQLIISHAAMVMKFLSVPLRDKAKLINKGNLSKAVIDLVPSSKPGFEKWGDGYAYHWATYFHDEILRSVKNEISGVDDHTRNIKSIARAALDSRRAQENVRNSLEEAGLPKTLANPVERDQV